ncbi:hypothetical protein SAMD00019534_110200 [Acytostelium subglobosum LB1]|uniref:hypothetical protein n=1 Tax=Acytostelium subglobosum LB1 TaxID=1410327 RepID=UPI0006449663|nr:hypothetical protein SAMD00019534_110200 [Acytostelium subglobosum LB1]GAM27844.1 hypothetical protein SAMD00019534_110200 [Acytostelium subglobosum LB1]|eukprot:XP_012749127.1 hypothetical protein SAMD00019534_110200 [Acytostelium subglobosum LB1]
MSFIKDIFNTKKEDTVANQPTIATSTTMATTATTAPTTTTPTTPTTNNTVPTKNENTQIDATTSPDEDVNLDNEDFDKEDEQEQGDTSSVLSKMKGLIGKDTMSLVSLPVYFFEPLTVLQSQCEPLRFINLIEKACELENSLDRMVHVAAFNIALFSSYVRTAKPFNPVLGETYEYVPKDGKYRTVCEQVSHHPPIGIAETSSDRFTLQQESHITTKFWGNSVDIFSLGNNHLHLHQYNDHFSWKVPSSCCHNIIFGKIWVEHHGQMTIVNNTTGEKAVLNFQKAGWFDSVTKKVSGEVLDQNGKKRYIITGIWSEFIDVAKLADDGVTKVEEYPIWRAEADPMEKDNKWKMGAFVQSLNDLTPEYEKILPVTDSRIRGDRRALQHLDNKKSSKEKRAIEEREREKRRERVRLGKVWTPSYFKKVDDAKFGYLWKFNGEYWLERDNRIKQQEPATKQTALSNGLHTDFSSMSLSDEVSSNSSVTNASTNHSREGSFTDKDSVANLVTLAANDSAPVATTDVVEVVPAN